MVERLEELEENSSIFNSLNSTLPFYFFGMSWSPRCWSGAYSVDLKIVQGNVLITNRIHDFHGSNENLQRKLREEKKFSEKDDYH